MSLVKAIVRPHAVEGVTDAVRKLGVEGITMTEVLSHEKQGGRIAIYRGREYTIGRRTQPTELG
jgi:nitrogen regulatory protein PII